MANVATEMQETKVLARRLQRRARNRENEAIAAPATKTRYSKESVLAAYRLFGSVKEACKETGCPPYIAYIWLTKAGMLNSKDRIQYGGRSQREGASAEQEFQRLVPDAMDCNAHMALNNPGHDFMLGQIKVDVKFSAIGTRGNWHFDVQRNRPGMRNRKDALPDFFVVFATEGKFIKDGYRLFLFPRDMVKSQRSVRWTPEVPSCWFDFEVEPEALAAILHEASI